MGKRMDLIYLDENMVIYFAKPIFVRRRSDSYRILFNVPKVFSKILEEKNVNYAYITVWENNAFPLLGFYAKLYKFNTDFGPRYVFAIPSVYRHLIKHNKKYKVELTIPQEFEDDNIEEKKEITTQASA